MPPARGRTWPKEMGFIGGKLPLHCTGRAEGDEGLRKNVELLADMRAYARGLRRLISG